MNKSSLKTAMVLSASLLALPALAQTATHPATTPMAGQTTGAATTGAATTGNNGTMGTNGTGTTGTSGGMMSGSNDSTYMAADGQIRASKIVGADVYNEKNDKIGSIYDVLMHKDGGAASVVVSVGGFLGMDAKYVDVPYSKLDIKANKIMMPGASKQSLTDLPTYHYSKS